MSCQAEQAEQSVQCLLSQPPPIQCGEIAYSSERVFCVETKDWNNAGMCLETCRSFVRSLPARSFHSIFSHSHCVITSVHWTPHELWTDKNWQCRRRRQEQQYLGGGDLQHERFHPSIRPSGFDGSNPNRCPVRRPEFSTDNLSGLELYLCVRVYSAESREYVLE